MKINSLAHVVVIARYLHFSGSSLKRLSCNVDQLVARYYWRGSECNRFLLRYLLTAATITSTTPQGMARRDGYCVVGSCKDPRDEAFRSTQKIVILGSSCERIAYYFFRRHQRALAYNRYISRLDILHERKHRNGTLIINAVDNKHSEK